MSYVVLVLRPAETPGNPQHRFRLSDERGQPRTFATRDEAEQTRATHLDRFPADEATVATAEEAGGG